MSYEITGKLHHGSLGKRRLTKSAEYKLKKRRTILPGYPINEPFTTKEEIDKYFSGDKLVCLLCGRPFKSLCGHLSVHGSNVDKYREEFGLPFSRGLIGEATLILQVKEGKKRREEGIFRTPTPEERKIYTKKSKESGMRKPLYANLEATKRILKSDKYKLFEDKDYWDLLERAKNEGVHPTDIIRKNKGNVPGISRFHEFRRKNKDFDSIYKKNVSKLHYLIQIKHGISPPEYIQKIKELKEEGLSNKKIGKILGVHELAVERHVLKRGFKKPEKTACINGHPYPEGKRKCQICGTNNARRTRGHLSREESKATFYIRKCSNCEAEIQCQRIYGKDRIKYCITCKREKYYESQRKYAREKRPNLKNSD